MPRIGFIGLGIMGLPMARNLLFAGFAVTGYNRSRARAELLAQAGGRIGGGIAETSEGEFIVTMLPDGPDVEEVILGAGGVLEHAREGSVVIDMSTTDPSVSLRVAERAAERGIDFLDAPVSGGERGAIERTLSIMVGGSAEAFDRSKDVLSAIGRTVTRVGSAGAGQSVKAANQLIVAVAIGAVAEALTMVEALGVDPAKAVEVLSGGLAGSRVLDQKAGMMIDRQFSPGFRAALHHKDMGIALSVARAAGVATPLGSVAAQELATLIVEGHGGLDHSGIKIVVDQLSGRS